MKGRDEFSRTGAGLAIARGNFCQPCLAKGHECPARDGSNECIFCEDGVRCPRMKTGMPVVTVHAENPQKFLEHGGAELVKAAVAHAKRAGS